MKKAVGQAFPLFVNRKAYGEIYSIVFFVYTQEFYQAVSNTVGRLDLLVVQSENTIGIFNYYEEDRAPITSFYPFDMSFVSDTLTDVSFEDNHLFLLPYDEQHSLTGYFSHAAESGIITIDQPSPNEITISLASDKESAVVSCLTPAFINFDFGNISLNCHYSTA